MSQHTATGAFRWPLLAAPLIGALLWAVVGLPAVFVATVAARRWPPSLSLRALRMAVFILLFLSGASLIVPTVSQV